MARKQKKQILEVWLDRTEDLNDYRTWENVYTSELVAADQIIVHSDRGTFEYPKHIVGRYL